MEEKNIYEIGFWIRLDSDVDSEIEKILSLIKNHNGEIIFNSGAKKRQLAYPIQKEKFGYFGYIIFNAPKNVLETINKELKIYKNILRYMIFKRKELVQKEKAEV